jgi:hypothetical protein
MSRAVKIVLPDPVATQLADLAASADQAPATLSAHMVRNAVALAAKDGKVRPLKPTHVVVGGGGRERPSWLEPYGGDPEWRSQMWGAIVALHGRYPRGTQRAQRRMVDRRITHRDTLRARRLASRNRRRGARPTRRAHLPSPARRLLTHPAAGRRRGHQGMEAGGASRGVGRDVVGAGWFEPVPPIG